MDKKSGGGGLKFTPDTARAWTLAFYPAAILLGVGFMIITERPVTTEVIGLFVGLLTAGSLQAAVKKNGDKNVQRSDPDDPGRGVHHPSGEELEDNDRSWADYLDRWRDRGIGFWRREVGGLPGEASGLQLMCAEG